jgi:hypothetical protein
MMATNTAIVPRPVKEQLTVIDKHVSELSSLFSEQGLINSRLSFAEVVRKGQTTATPSQRLY